MDTKKGCIYGKEAPVKGARCPKLPHPGSATEWRSYHSHLLLRNQRHSATIMPARMKANGNFSDANERFYSVRINRTMSLRDAIDLGRPCNSLFEFQVVHRYVFIVM